MPYIVRPKGTVRNVAATLISSALLVCAVPAVASAASCPTNATSHVFSSFGDNASYFAAPGGTFESGASSWSLEDAAVTNEEGHHGGNVSHALRIHGGGRAVSPGFCVNSEYPTFRFLLRQVWGDGGQLKVGLRYSDRSGSHEVSVASLQGGSNWAISPVEQLASNLPLAASAGTLTPVQLVFESASYADYAISGVYIDPYRR
jgi:hypothetical protein